MTSRMTNGVICRTCMQRWHLEMQNKKENAKINDEIAGKVELVDGFYEVQ